MTRHKNEIANGVRLENASWRTWWKQRNKLRTISPETLNWLKDSDVTWLYGPLHTAVEPVPPPKVATTDERLGIVRHDKKPILKHRTLSEMLSIPMPSSPILESTGVLSDLDEYDLEENGIGRPQLLHTKSDTNIVRSNRRISPPRPPIGSNDRTPTSAGSSGDDLSGISPGQGQGLPQPADTKSVESADSHSTAKRHISFNTFVEQCIAVDDPEDAPANSSDDDEDDSSDDGVLEIKSASSMSSRSSRSSRPSLSRHSSTSSDHVTIAKIAPTMLKTTGNHPSPSPAVVYAPPEAYAELHRRRSSVSDDSPGAGPSASASYDFPSPPTANKAVASSQWDDDDDEYSVGFDYFSGPDLGVGDEYNTPRNQSSVPGRTAVQSHVGSGPSYGGQSTGKPGTPSGQATPTVVGQPPQQAKWRASNNAATGGGSVSTSTSSSTTSTARPSPTLDPAYLPTSPPGQPGRSILKIRPPGSAPPPQPESTSPSSSYFNFNPSAATGFGGMGHRGQGREPAASSLPLYEAAHTTTPWQSNSVPPTGTITPPIGANYGTPSSPSNAGGEGNERGRSAIRTSSLAERSLSRGTSTSASVSPNSIRSPVQIPAPVASGSTRVNIRPGQVDSASGGPNTQQVTTPPAKAVSPIGSSPLASPGNIIPQLQAPQPVKPQEPAISTTNVIPDDERAGTPTPHSSPLITMGRMADTSPASLPHAQTDATLGPAISKGTGSATSAAATAIFAAQASNSSNNHFNPKRHQRSPSLPSAGAVLGEPRRVSASSGQPEGLDDEEGGSMYGRAINIANTAKDLFGALWGYGAQPPPSGQHAGGSTEDKEQTDGGPAF